MPDVPMTLEHALRSHAIDRREVVRRYPGPVSLVRRILGVVPHAVSYFEIWPPALVTYNLVVPALLDVPRCDMGLGISPDLRALVAHAASRGFGCQYCMAHTAVMGTVIRGPLRAPQIASRVFGLRELDSLGPGARAAVEYAGAVLAVPSRLTAAKREALTRAFKPDHVEAIALVASAMGYLNRFMDTLGTVLETAVLAAVEGPLGNTGWDAGKHFDEERDAALGNGDETLTRPSRLGLVREIPDAVAYEREALAAIPRRPADQAERLRAELGFVPYYVEATTRDAARRVLVHLLLERLRPDGDEVSAATKARLGWVMARAAANRGMAAHFAFAAHRAGVEVAALQADLTPPADPTASRPAAALALAHAASTMATTVGPEVIEGLVRHHRPASIIELLLAASVASCLQVYTTTFPPARDEPEIADFLAEHGAALDLPPVPCTRS